MGIQRRSFKASSAAELNKCNVERPKVMYNASTKQFVMWMHGKTEYTMERHGLPLHTEYP
jgi:type IV secretory pathway VirB4 component